MRKRTQLHKYIGTLLALGLMVSAVLPVRAAVTQEDLAKPVVDKSTHNLNGYGYENRIKGAKHDTTYHYVYFGSYPQREIKGEELTSEIINASYDTYGNGEVNGKRYRRISYEFTTIYMGINGWPERFAERSINGYRYYLYEPIKWRIYDNDGTTLFLATDSLLEQKKYDLYAAYNTWAECGLRRWLNYDGGAPDVPVGFETWYQYHDPGFMYYAFTQEEIDRIKVTRVKQDNCPETKNGKVYSSGEDTEDKIFILNYTESANIDYGGCINDDYKCAATQRWATDYAVSMTMRGYTKDEGGDGEWREIRTGDYWLRTVGIPCVEAIHPVMTNGDGWVGFISTPNDEYYYVVPALNMNYSLADCIRVSFETGTEVTIEDQIYMNSSIAKEPDIVRSDGSSELVKLQKEGYLFTGWYTDSECTKPYRFDRKLTQDTTLYAGWKKRQPVAEYVTKQKLPKTTVAITDAVILGTKSDSDLKGSSFGLLQAAAGKTTKTTVKLKWNKLGKADGYEIYGAECNTKKKKNRYKKIKTITNKNTNTYTHKKRKKGTYYKYIVRAYKEIEGQKISIAVSKTIHVTTTGGRYGNAGKIKTSKSTVSLKKGKKYTLKTREVAQSKKIQKHRAVAYESDNTKIATVSKKGVIKGKKKGSCNIYVYAQNGVYKKIKVKIK